MDEVRYGIIGYGNMGSGHANNFAAGKIHKSRLVAIADINPVKIERARTKFGDSVLYFDNAEALIKSGKVDAIIIAVPHYFHPGIAIMALKNNLHVMTEKPAGVYTKQVREMNKAASESDKLFGIMFQNRLNPYNKKMHDMVAAGELGEIKRTIYIVTDWYRSQSYYDSGSWRATWAGEGGGVLLNQCPHSLDLWQWIAGMMPSKIRAFCHNGKWHNIEVEDDVSAYVEYPNGGTGVFVTSTADAPGTNRMEIHGNMGKLVYAEGKITFFKLKQGEREFNASYKGGFGNPECEKIDVDVQGVFPEHSGVLNNFTDAILTSSPLMIPGYEGIKGLTLSNAMHLSSWLDKTIELPLDEDLYYEELKKRIKTSKYKETLSDKTLDLKGSF